MVFCGTAPIWPPRQKSSPAVSSVVSLLLHTVGVPCDDTGSHELPITKHKHFGKFCLDNFIQRIQSGNWIAHYNNLGIQLNYNKVDIWTTILPRQRRKQAYPLYTERQSRGGGGDPTTLLELERRVSQWVRHNIGWMFVLRVAAEHAKSIPSHPWCCRCWGSSPCCAVYRNWSFPAGKNVPHHLDQFEKLKGWDGSKAT